MESFVDDANYKWLNGFSWWAVPGGSGRKFYCYAKVDDRVVSMHRLILNIINDSCKIGDHINGESLDNRRCNLRITTRSEMRYNAKGKLGSSSIYRGVKKLQSGNFCVSICYKGIESSLGTYKDEWKAAQIYNKKAIQVFGEYAHINVKGVG